MFWYLFWGGILTWVVCMAIYSVYGGWGLISILILSLLFSFLRD